MTEQITDFDASEYLDNSATRAAYLQQALDTCDMDLFLSALGDVAKAEGMTAIAKRSGLTRASLYKAVLPGAKPRFDTVAKIARALGLPVTFGAAT